MPPRLQPRGSDLPTNIEACLHMLSGIIQKYQDQDDDDMPQENDYLQAMDLLKRINDLKLTVASSAVSHAAQNAQIHTVTRVVIQWRERQSIHPAPVRVQSASAMSMLSELDGYIECPICQHFVKDRYALTRHQKRITCKQVALMKAVMTPKFRLFIDRLNRKFLSTVMIREPFLLQLSFLFLRAQPIIRRPHPDGHVPLVHGKPFPQRLLPKMLWKSIWDPRGSFHDDAFLFPKDSTRMLIYNPSLFFGKVCPRPYMERKSLTAWPNTKINPPAPPMIWTLYQLNAWRDDGPWSNFAFRMSIDIEDDERETDLSGWV